MKRAVVAQVAGALAMALSFLCGPAGAVPDPHAARRMMASRYEMHGLVEKAVAEYLRILASDPQDPQARARVEALVNREMPMWLPEEAEAAAPFDHEAVGFEFPPNGRDPGAQKARYRLLLTRGAFPAQEGARWDEVHETGFTRIDYAYVWQPTKKRYEVRVAAHWEEEGQTELAQRALRATLALYCLVKEYLGFDPTGRWGDPVDVWVTDKGTPGARAQGRSIYLYAAETPRPAGEWLREVGHEYGHASFPGIGGFEDTDDEWADGHLAELLFPKWLSACGTPEWMPWSVQEWEAQARPERGRLMAAARAAARDTALLNGKDGRARDHFVGLALLVEEAGGPEMLARALAKCRQGRAGMFVQAAREVGAEVGD